MNRLWLTRISGKPKTVFLCFFKSRVKKQLEILLISERDIQIKALYAESCNAFAL